MTSPATATADFILPLQRPPKPAPVLFGTPRTTVPKVISTMDASSSSRASLRQRLDERRTALTAMEHRYLENLVVHGDEIEVQLASECLMDTELFFDHPDASLQPFDSSSRDCRDESMSSLGSLGCGSLQRQEILEDRKRRLSTGNLFKAHLSGLQLSQQASRRSIRARRQSMSALNSTRLDAYNANINIFRKSIPRVTSSPLLATTDQNSDTYRRIANSERLPLPSSREASTSSFNSLPPIHRKPAFRRMQSDSSSRKSVTFKDPPANRRISVDHIASTGGPRKLFKARSDSLPSIPSMGTPHSQSDMSDDQSSIPSIHHAHHVHEASTCSLSSIEYPNNGRSQSFASAPSLRLSHPILSQSFSIKEERDATSTTTLDAYDEGPTLEAIGSDGPTLLDGGIPNRVEIFHRQQIQQSNNPPIAPATKLLSHDEEPDEGPLKLSVQDKIFMREASQQHEGFEMANFASSERRPSFKSMASFGSIKSTRSFDDSVILQRFSGLSGVFRRPLLRSLSDENMQGIFLGRSRALFTDTSTQPMDDETYGLDDDDSSAYYDSWKVIEDEYVNGYGGGGTLPFHILGTSGDDVDALPHVLSPPLMESLQAFLPQSVSGDNFWLKFSLVRDGASLHTFLQYARGATHTVLAIETVDGEVFGAFTSATWRKNWNFFGSSESFLWRMKHTRKEKCHSIIDQAHMESEIEVFPFVGQNTCIQLCTQNRIAVGGGSGGEESEEFGIKPHDWGFGLALESDLLTGTSSPCLTFSSPSLSWIHGDGSRFEVMNLELWTLTPCTSVEEAEKLELGRLFLRNHGKDT